MKHQFLIALLFCVPLLSSIAREEVRKPLDLNMALVFVMDEKGADKHIFLINGHVAFRTVDGLKKYLTGMPRGSNLSWAPGCLRMGNEPLLESQKEMKKFREFCKSRGINFVLIPSG